MSRPRSFDESIALQAALRTFWRYGYEGTSIEMLSEAMAMNKASIYRVFGSKQDLFQRVRQLYHKDYLGFRVEALQQDSPRAIVEDLLHGMVQLHADGETPAGCLETNAALAAGPDNEMIRADLAQSRDALRGMLTQRFQDLSTDQPLPPGMSPESAAAVVSTLIQGLAVQAKSGRSREELSAVVESILSAWPTSTTPSELSTGVPSNA
ncbi:TetR/AcrR family transcriptional regulator [Arthrobacter sp. SLBN-112]|uniref:TetR/AcrR family transcriptional regulator n=1 Tax=Arthrobacter sp. SLBN-112 TaxID=2768452 RepID=UPI0027B2FF9F|nr:AcrR family transcriptional regulator [Arthrobacter sp. SLBN-112]